ncbi:UNVERIFIED_CONTAM: hypothetical protein Slati_1701300 [Sesamum latifolium]|uniref:Integrase catalytic domain-containing protein n=1 Tax=Sesamum latifolium TaxID=2727402 RepID=A0AAW2WVR6_9LAMI
MDAKYKSWCFIIPCGVDDVEDLSFEVSVNKRATKTREPHKRLKCTAARAAGRAHRHCLHAAVCAVCARAGCLGPPVRGSLGLPQPSWDGTTLDRSKAHCGLSEPHRWEFPYPDYGNKQIQRYQLQRLAEESLDCPIFRKPGLCLGQATPTALPEGSSPEERLTFEKWHEDNHKVRSIILASMTNKIQKQYDRLEDVPSIMLRMKDVYAVSDRHIRYAAIKAFFGTKMAEGSSVHSHGVKMLSLVEKLEDLKVGLNNDTYIDVILQSLPPSYDPFIINYNMNGLEKSIHELINMLVQYEATTHKSERAVLEGEASTSKAKGKGARRWKRKKGKRTAVTATASTGGAPPAAPKGKGKGRWGSQRLKQMMCACIAKERGIGRGVSTTPLQPRKLSKDEMILRLGDGKAVAAEAVGSLSLVVSNRIRIDLKDCYLCQGKMTKKPFVGQSDRQRSVGLGPYRCCGPLSISARGGFSYFITFIDDHSRYGYVYLMRYKSEAFGRFKEYKLEVENQTNCKIKVLRSDRGCEYLSGEFINYLKENGILSQWTPPGTPKLNGVVERRNRTLLDMVQSMMSFSELPPSFWGYALETAAKLLNIAPSKSVPQTPYEIWHGKPASYKYLRVWGSPAYVKRLVGDKLDSRSSLCRFIGYPKETAGYHSATYRPHDS